MNNVMVDIETLGTGQNTVVLSIALVRFNERTEGEDLHIKFNRHEVRQQVEKGRIIDPDTVMWWLRQDSDAQKAITETYNSDFSRDMEVALEQVLAFVKPDDIVWANPPSFDIAILEDLMRDFNMPCLIKKHFNVRDLRTMKKVLGTSPKPENFIAHDALHDCMQQIRDLRAGLDRIGMLRAIA